MADNDHFTPDAPSDNFDGDTLRESESLLDCVDRHLAEALNDTGQQQGAKAKPCPISLDELRRGVAAAVKCDEQESTLLGEVVFQAGLPLVGLKARLIYQKLSNLGEVRYFAPPPAQLEEQESLDRVAFGVVTEKPAADVRAVLRIAGVEHISIEPLLENPSDVSESTTPKSDVSPESQPATAGAAERTAAAAPNANGVKPMETVRVDRLRLDQLMDLAGQLTIHEASITRTATNLQNIIVHGGSSAALKNAAAILDRIRASNSSGTATSTAAPAAAQIESLRGMARCALQDLDVVQREFEAMFQAGECVKHLIDSGHHLDRVSDGIHQAAMDLRMAPIGPLFGRFKRVIRDLTRAGGKNVRLVISGEHVELHKRMIDELGDPLIQLVRNAIEHGIESPAERQAAGKPAQGAISLDASRRGNSVVVQISDDGRGLDVDRIRARAVQRNIASAAEVGEMSQHDVVQLLWEPGMSTTERSAKLPDRGAGLNDVRLKISDLSGTIDLDSEPGRGATLTIKLPLTLAILPSLIVAIDGDVFAVPLESVAEIVWLKPHDMTTVHGLPTARVRERTISMVSIGELLTWSRTHRKSDIDRSRETAMVILEEKGRQLGLVVDQVLGDENVVIKSIAENYRTIPGVTGACVRGDGRVSLILDPPSMFKMLSRGNAALAAKRENVR